MPDAPSPSPIPRPRWPAKLARGSRRAGPLLAGLLLAGAGGWWLGPPVLLIGAALLAGAVVGRWLTRLQLRAELRQLQAEGAGDRPPLLLLAPVARCLDQLQSRQQALFEAQAEQLETLRRQAHTDALTGLSNRRHFLAQLDMLLGGDERPAEVGLLLLRVPDLQGMNQRIGHAGTDLLLQLLAQVLQTYVGRVERCCAGRIDNGGFALALPVGGLAGETAATLMQTLRQPLARIDAKAGLLVGVVELGMPIAGSQALALAEAALAVVPDSDKTRAGAGEVDLDLPLSDDRLANGEASWQYRIARALVKGEVELAAYPVRTADGRQLHLDCPLRLRLRSGGPLEPAARWLSLATRVRLCAALDERAVALALQAIAADGQARCINLAAQSLASAAFVDAVSERLAAAPQAASRLWIDLPESLALAEPQRLRALARRWRPLGVMLGMEHAGEGLARLPQLMDLGLECVRIDGRFVNGIAGAGNDDARRFLQGLVRLVQAVGLQITAEGVRSAADLELLWRMGFDAATGPALVAEPVEAIGVAA